MKNMIIKKDKREISKESHSLLNGAEVENE
jgi:hypothetical protein